MIVRKSTVLVFTRYALLGLASTLVPIALWQLDSPITSNTYGESYELFELFGFCASLSLIINAIIELKTRDQEPIKKAMLVVLPTLVGFFFLTLITEYSFKAWDYGCYEQGAKAIITGSNPYVTGDTICYAYPPLPAQTIALLYRIADKTISAAKITATQSPWGLVFYVYQCAQFFLINLAFSLCHRFAKRLGLGSIAALVIVGIVFVVNNPLIRNFRHNQINLWILNATLLTILLVEKHPIVSGVFTALAGHIKLYPLIFAAPWSLAKKWLPLLGLGIGLFGILLLQTHGGRDWELWLQFISFFTLFRQHETKLRSNSFQSIVHNTIKVVFGDTAIANARILPIRDTIVGVITLATACWLLVRLVRRGQSYSKLWGKNGGGSNKELERMRSYADLADCLAFMLLISPVVWEHHYILAIPFALWAIAIHGRDKPWQIGIGTLLMFALPTFDVFPFSYHRIAGLLVLLFAAPPKIFHKQQPWGDHSAINLPEHTDQ